MKADNDLKRDLRAEDRKALAEAVSRVLATDDGKRVVEHLLDLTLRADWPHPLASMHDTDFKFASACAMRKGQNMVLVHLLQLDAEARSERFSLPTPL